MNILYRTISEKTNKRQSLYDRFVFYQEHFYDNIYYTDANGVFIGYTNYSIESKRGFDLKKDYIDFNCPVKSVKDWFYLHPGEFRVPVLERNVLVGEYYDSDSVGKCLYQNIEDKALEIANCFNKEIQAWGNDKNILIKSSDANKVSLLHKIITNADTNPNSNNNYDYIIDLNICPDFRKRIYGINSNVISVSEILIPILIMKLGDYFKRNNIGFYIFNGIKKSELKDLYPVEHTNIQKSIEEVLQDDDYISSFVGTDSESREYIERHKVDLNQLAKFKSNGIHNILLDKHEKYLNINDGIRFTSDTPRSANKAIHIFGPCIVFGLCVSDSQTIASHLQKLTNQEECIKANVINHGLSYGKDLLNDVLYMMCTPLSAGDTIVWLSGFSSKELSYFKAIDLKVYDLKNKVEGMHNWFLNNPFHCNSIANYVFAKYINEVLISNQFQYCLHGKKSMIEADNISLKFDNDAIIHSPQMDEYIKFLQQYRIDNNQAKKGCVVINANPCTKGHIHLIKEALKEVDFLYIFLVQESSLGFSYLDRESMLKTDLRDINNIVILPGGDIFTSAISFPEYFNRTAQAINPLNNHRIFCEKIAPALNISIRFFGEESEDNVTRILNMTAKEQLPQYGIRVKIIPRLTYSDKPISAKNVRKYLKQKNIETLSRLVSPETLDYLLKFT